MPNLAEICEKCKAKTEKSIDNYIEELQSLKDQNESLKAENDELKNRPVQIDPAPDGRDALIDLIEEDIIWQEAHLQGKGERFKKIVETYRAIRPKKG